MELRVIRTFHPVGEGAFYTEVFKDKEITRFVTVYDCGTKTGDRVMEKTINKQIEEFKSSLGPNPKIDLLFISHFHGDHTSGLVSLLKNVEVEKTVIPMLDNETITVTRLQNFLSLSKKNANNADKIIRKLYYGEGNDEVFGKIRIVPPTMIENTGGDGTKYIQNGEVFSPKESNGVMKIWKYIPFNSIDFKDNRAKTLFTNLEQLNVTSTNGILNINALIRDHLKEVKTIYKQVIGNNFNENLYTMVVVSQPIEGVEPQPNCRLSHGVYFGDFDYDQESKPWQRFNKVINFDEIGTVQVPHHGAKGNWNKEMGKGERRDYIVSSGSTNGDNHPCYWVLQDIWDNGHDVYVVSEKIKTKKEYEFIISD